MVLIAVLIFSNGVTPGFAAVRGARASAIAAFGFVVHVEVTDGGEGYLSPPAITLTGGGGSGAGAVANVTNGAVVSITMVRTGFGYSNAPSVTITPPPGLSIATVPLLTVKAEERHSPKAGLQSAPPSVLATSAIPFLTLKTELGYLTRIEWADDLTTGPWHFVTNIVGTGATLEWSDASATASTVRYYRSSFESLPPSVATNYSAETTNAPVTTTNAPATDGSATPPISNPDPDRLAWIEAGSFLMGSPADEKERLPREAQHRVVLSQGFFMSKFLVTQGDYLALVGANPSYFVWARGYSNDLRRPVEQVTWQDATNYCGRFNGQELIAQRLPDGWAYRLPTEAEWEYACRAGTTSPFYYGSDLRFGMANFDGRYEYYEALGGVSTPLGAHLDATTPVGSYQPNGWGLYDMAGNVWEWCLDWYGAYPTDTVTDPQGPSGGWRRVLRGGDWYEQAKNCRSAFAGYYDPNGSTCGIGFRLVLAPALTVTVTNPPPVSTNPPPVLTNLPPVITNTPPPFDNPAPDRQVWIGTGSFMMGSPATESARVAREVQHPVALTTGYFMRKFPVTQGEYVALMGVNPSYFVPKNGFTEDLNRPAEQVTWQQAINYCGRFSQQEQLGGRLPEGWVYRLPTEAEWEYACRAETTTPFYFGSNLLSGMINCDGRYEYSAVSGGVANPEGIHQDQTTAVGAYAPNGWGLYDMAGNVWQWCMDWYGPYASGVLTNPPGPAMGTQRVLRGGDWYEQGKDCRSAFAGYYDPDGGTYGIGFRMVLAPVTSLTFTNPPPVTTNPPPVLTNLPPVITNTPPPFDNPAPDHQVWIGTGSFMMGSPVTELGRATREAQHPVALTAGFFMGKYPVTQGEYLALTGSNPSYFVPANGFAQDLNRPAEQVTWRQATNYCGLFSQREQLGGRLPAGWVYRLPTEAEWEYACRAGTTTPFYFGSNLLSGMINFDGRHEYSAVSGGVSNPEGIHLDQTTAVGAYAPNGWGLYDMAGNVWNWCLDWYGAYPVGTVTNPPGPASGTKRVMRGGTWFDQGWTCRSAFAGYYDPDGSTYSIGFRMVLAPAL